jgi:hypothetical protein
VTDGVSLPEAIGRMVMVAARLEHQLAASVAGLTWSPLSYLIVAGQPPSSLVRMAKEILARGVRVSDDGAAGTMTAADVAGFRESLATVSKLLDDRNRVVHAVWMTEPDEPGVHQGYPVKMGAAVTEHTAETLDRLRQDLLNVTHDLFVLSWNATREPSDPTRMAGRGGRDVIG